MQVAYCQPKTSIKPRRGLLLSIISILQILSNYVAFRATEWRNICRNKENLDRSYRVA